MQAIGSALDNADLVVQALDKAQGDLIFGFAVSGNACPLPFDERCKLLIGFKALPLQLRLSVLQELPRPGFAGVVPQLREGFLEQIGGVQALVGGKQELQILASRAFEVLRMRQQGIFLPLDERAILAAQSRVLELAHLISLNIIYIMRSSARKVTGRSVACDTFATRLSWGSGQVAP